MKGVECEGMEMALLNDQVYIERGYKSRREYLDFLAESYDVDKGIVYGLANMLGRNEDFDGLVIAIADYADGISQ